MVLHHQLPVNLKINMKYSYTVTDAFLSLRQQSQESHHIVFYGQGSQLKEEFYCWFTHDLPNEAVSSFSNFVFLAVLAEGDF